MTFSHVIEPDLSERSLQLGLDVPIEDDHCSCRVMSDPEVDKGFRIMLHHEREAADILSEPVQDADRLIISRR